MTVRDQLKEKPVIKISNREARDLADGLDADKVTGLVVVCNLVDMLGAAVDEVVKIEGRQRVVLNRLGERLPS